MVDLPRAELAMGEVLVFEVAVERFFGFQSSGFVAAGVAVESAVGRATAAALLQAAGTSTAGMTAAARASALLQAIGSAVATFEGRTIQKLSGAFSMAGSSTWYAQGLTFMPRMPLADDRMFRSSEARGMSRPPEHRAMAVLPDPDNTRYEERRGATR